jgi:hypothetical protein
LLGAIFTEKGIPRGDILELSKSDFVGILKDSGILILKKEDKKDDILYALKIFNGTSTIISLFNNNNNYYYYY